MRRTLALLVFGAILVVGCGGDDASDTFDRGEATEQADTATLPDEDSGERPNLSVEIAWFDVKRDSDVLRFLAYIANLSDWPATGVRAEWTAYDAADVIVGNFTTNVPTIPAGETFPYVGGAGGLNLTGTPARVEVTIADPGQLEDGAPSPFLHVSDVRVEQAYRTAYDVRATLSAPDRDIDSSTVWQNMVLFDEVDEIILADFGGDVRAPASITAGQRFGVEFYVPLARRVPARADVTAWTE